MKNDKKGTLKMFIMMRYPEGRKKAFTMSYDDGVFQDIRLMEIMEKNGLKGTFNFNCGLIGKEDAAEEGRLSERQLKVLFSKPYVEVAVHSYTHPSLTSLTPELITYEVLRDRERMEEMFGGIVRGMAYPNGSFDDKTVECLKSCGIVYSRTTKSTEDFKIADDWLRLPATCHHNNPRLFELGEKFLRETSPKDRECWLFYLWGHSYEFDRDNNWDRIEKFAETIGGHDEVWYATNIEIYDYIEAYKSLKFSLSESAVHNPSAIDVWFQNNNGIYKVPSGETVRL